MITKMTNKNYKIMKSNYNNKKIQHKTILIIIILCLVFLKIVSNYIFKLKVNKNK
jgi:hypothetical protein